MALACFLFELVLSLGCMFGIFFDGWVDTMSWICFAIIIIEIIVLGLSSDGGIGGVIGSAIVGIIIPACVAIPLSIFVFHLGVIQTIFLIGTFHCVIGWVATLFDL